MTLLAVLGQMAWTSLVALLLPLLLGCALVPPSADSPSLARRIYFGFLAGGGLGLVLYALEAPQWLFLASVAIACGVGLLRLARWLRLGHVRAPVCFTLVALPLALRIAEFCWRDPVSGWDGYVIWFARVRMMEIAFPFHAFQTTSLPHPTYPFLGVVWWWLVSTASGAAPEFGRVIYGIVYMAFFADVFNAFCGRDRRMAWPVFGILMHALMRLEWVGGYQDGLVMTLTAWSAWILLTTPLPRALLLLPALGALSQVKMEGGVFGAALLVAFLAVHARELAAPVLRRRTLLALAGYGAVAALWPIVLRVNHLDASKMQEGAFSGITAGWLLGNLSRIPTILRAILAAYPLLQWALVLANALLLARFLRPPWPRWRGVALLGLYLVAHHAFIVVAFWATRSPFQWHMHTALARLTIDAQLIWLVLLAEVLRQIVRPREAQMPVPVRSVVTS